MFNTSEAPYHVMSDYGVIPTHIYYSNSHIVEGNTTTVEYTLNLQYSRQYVISISQDPDDLTWILSYLVANYLENKCNIK
jgi:hypothetical protein